MSNQLTKIRYTITACISGTACNFNCDYCYRKNQGIKEKTQPTTFQYPVDHMVKALSPKRLGGIADIVVIGGGETLLHKDVVPFIKGLLKDGHIVEVVTNLTLNERIDELLDMDEEMLSRLIVKGSLHYLELKKLNKLDDYFNNMKKIIQKGASSFPFLVIYEDYLPLLDEIKEVCLNKIGELPHCTSALDFTDAKMQPLSFYNENYKKSINDKMDSNINRTFDKFLSIDPKEHFCYAGEWSFVLDTSSGDVNKCFYSPVELNIFKDLDKKITMDAIGNCCCIGNCALHYNLTGQGILPEFKDILPYGDIINKTRLFNPKVIELLNFKYYDYMPIHSTKEEKKISKKTEKLFFKIETKNLSFKNKIRLNVYKYLKKKLERKGLI